MNRQTTKKEENAMWKDLKDIYYDAVEYFDGKTIIFWLCVIYAGINIVYTAICEGGEGRELIMLGVVFGFIFYIGNVLIHFWAYGDMLKSMKDNLARGICFMLFYCAMPKFLGACIGMMVCIWRRIFYDTGIFLYF